jgi:putative nucleotidyltransferase with HDIG domain
LGTDRSTPPLSSDKRRRAQAAETTAGSGAVHPTRVRAADAIRGRFGDPSYHPPELPPVAMELQRLASSSDTTFASVVPLLESDRQLAARVLRLARTAGPQLPVRSLREATERMGLRPVVELVWRAALDLGVFRNPAHREAPDQLRRALEQLRQHGTMTGYLARSVALFSPVPVEYAFLGGLVHDIGLAAALILLGAEQTPVEESDIRAVASLHEQLSAEVARRWNLPEDVQIALARHHHLGDPGREHPLSAVILLAEHLSRSLGAPQPLAAAGWDPIDRQWLRRAHTALELSPAQLKLVEAEARHVLAELRV